MTTVVIVGDSSDMKTPFPVRSPFCLGFFAVTLLVGDYLLTPSVVVERKSITDLFQSFATGHLFTQVGQCTFCDDVKGSRIGEPTLANEIKSWTAIVWSSL